MPQVEDIVIYNRPHIDVATEVGDMSVRDYANTVFLTLEGECVQKLVAAAAILSSPLSEADHDSNHKN